MAFQPNYYQVPYMNYGQNYVMPNYQAQQYQPMQMNQQSASLPSHSQYPMISGKMVESVEVMNAQETPVGGYSVFPLMDFSKVYIKAYDKEGNIQVYKYDLNKTENPAEDPYSTKLDDIYAYITKLDKKIDGIKPSSAPLPHKKKVVEEVDEDDE